MPYDPDDDTTAPRERVEAVAAALRERGERFAEVTVVRREAPVSANVGDRAVVTADGEVTGWVGGVECAQSVAVREARRAIEAGEPRLIGLAPDPETVKRPGVEAFEMTCHSGGTLELFIDPVVPATRLVVVGATPVATALVRLAAQTDLDVTLVDPEAGEHPEADAVVGSRDSKALADALDDRSNVVLASMGGFDHEGLVAAVRAGVPYVGLVASDRRAADLFDRVADDLGVDAGRVADAVSVPAGVDIEAETPVEIAVSILAEVVDVVNGGRARRPPVAVDADPPPSEPRAVDPVCGMSVSTEEAAESVEHDGETYYFCCSGCAETFRTAPGEYVAGGAP